MLISFGIISFFTLNVYIESSLESKILFSRLRYFGFAIVAPAGLLFYSSILKVWSWPHTVWGRTLILSPALVTILINFGVLNPNLLVHSHTALDYLGVSVLTFKTGSWFTVHYLVNMAIAFMVIVVHAQAFILDKQKRLPIFILSLGVVLGTLIDIYCVVTNSPLRWLMLSAGTFVFTQLAIFYITHKYELLGILSTDKKKWNELQENLEFQNKMLALLAHDLSGNIRNQARIAQSLKNRLQYNHHEILDALAASSKASDDLIVNIMRWVKSQEGQFSPHIESVDIHKLFLDCVRTIQTSLENQKIEIHTEVPSDPFYLRCDADMMSAVFRNLISNAVKASSEQISVLFKVSEDESRVRIEVKDQGIGMSAEQLDALWNVTAKKQKLNGDGYGIGLLLARHFVELHNGKLEITSVKNQGTLAQVIVPR